MSTNALAICDELRRLITTIEIEGSARFPDIPDYTAAMTATGKALIYVKELRVHFDNQRIISRGSDDTQASNLAPLNNPLSIS